MFAHKPQCSRSVVVAVFNYVIHYKNVVIHISVKTEREKSCCALYKHSM